MTYTEYVINYLAQVRLGVPIYTADIAMRIANAFDLEFSKAKTAAAVAVKRIMDGRKIENLRCLKKGIYYLAIKTPFGETGIDKEALIQRKYIVPDEGYETGLTALYKLGLTSQLPNERLITTNRAKECQRKDTELDVVIRPPKVKITAENKQYLQALDIVELIDKAPIDANDPFAIIADFMSEKHLHYHKLLAFADKYYNQNTIMNLAHIAAVGGI